MLQKTCSNLALGLVLQHEAYRDGIIGAASQQSAETLAATTAHTQMALRMLGDGKGNAIQMTENLAMDIIAYQFSQGLGDETVFSNYVAGNYDSSGDYWRLMDDGTLVNDGSGWLRDGRGRAIKNKDGKQIGADGLESGLLNILFGGTNGKGYNEFSVMQKIISFSILEDSGIGKSYPDGKYGMSNAQWDKNDKRALNMDYVMKYAGNTIATQVFTQYYDSTVDSIIAGSQGIYLGANVNMVSAVAEDRFDNLYQTKSAFYESAGSFVDSNSVKVSQGYKEKFDGYYHTYNNLHYGLDIVVKNNSNVSVEGANIMAGLSGKIISNTMELEKGKGAGNSVHIEYGYKFEDSFIGTGIYGEYNHFQQQSIWKVGSDVNATTVLGTLGNTGNSTGPHLHYSVYTTGRNNYSNSTMSLLFGNDYEATMMQSITTHENGSKTYNSKFVYDPTIFYEKNQKGRLQ